MLHGDERKIVIRDEIVSLRISLQKRIPRGKLDRNQKKRMITRKAHKNRVFIINPLSAKSIWVKVKLGSRSNFGSRSMCVWCQMVNVCVCYCIWLRQMSLLTSPMAPLADSFANIYMYCMYTMSLTTFNQASRAS